MSAEPTHAELVLRGAHAIGKQLMRGYGIGISAPSEEQIAETLATVAALYPNAPLELVTFTTPEAKS